MRHLAEAAITLDASGQDAPLMPLYDASRQALRTTFGRWADFMLPAFGLLPVTIATAVMLSPPMSVSTIPPSRAMWRGVHLNGRRDAWLNPVSQKV